MLVPIKAILLEGGSVPDKGIGGFINKSKKVELMARINAIKKEEKRIDDDRAFQRRIEQLTKEPLPKQEAKFISTKIEPKGKVPIPVSVSNPYNSIKTLQSSKVNIKI